MIIQWIKNIFGIVNPESLSQGAREADRRARAKLSEEETDQAAAAEAAFNKGFELLGVLQKGGQILQRQKLKREIRKTVQSKIASVYNHPEIVDEVTERITEATLSDPFYKRLFSSNSSVG